MKTDKEIRELVLELIMEIDYDTYKFYVPELSEDPDSAEEDMQRLIKIVKEFANE